MPVKKTNKKTKKSTLRLFSSKSNKKAKTIRLGRRQFNRTRAFTFVLVFAFIGTYVILHSLAAAADYYSENDQYNRVNGARNAGGLASLFRGDCMTRAARDWSMYMAQQHDANPNYALGHSYTAPGHGGIQDLQKSNYCGTAGSGGWKFGENVGFQSGPVGKDLSGPLFQAFMNSPEHRANIMDSTYKEVGIGAWRSNDNTLWVTQVFVYCDGCSSTWYKAASVPSTTSSAPAPAPAPSPSNPHDLYFVKFNGASGHTELHMLTRASGYQTYGLHTAMPIEPSNSTYYAYKMGDYDRDGKPDLYMIKMGSTGSGRTEVHILSGASGYQSFLLHAAIPIELTSSSIYQWVLGDYNHDGRIDLYAIKTAKTGSGAVEVQFLNGADNYQSFLLHTATPVSLNDGAVMRFDLSDYDVNGSQDLMAYKPSGASGTFEVHVLSGSNNFQSWLLHTATPLSATSWSVFYPVTADYDNDGKADLYTIKMNGTGSNSTEIHVLDHDGNFQRWDLHTGTPLEQTTAAGYAFAAW